MVFKPDRFTWIVLAVVVALLVAAVVTVNRGAPASSETLNYRADDAPETPVYNAFVATERGELYRAREQYTASVLEQMERDRYDPFSAGYRDGETSRQLRIISVAVDTENPDRALVTVIEDYYSPSGPFGSGNTWSNRRAIPVAREDGIWKIDAIEVF